MGPCHPPDGACPLALDKLGLLPEVDLYTLLTRRQGLVCPKITVDDATSCEGRPKSLAVWI